MMLAKKKRKFKLPDLCQIGIVTKNLDKTIKEFEDLYGIRPFVVVERQYVNTYIRGKPAKFQLKIALYRGTDQVDIEVIEVKKGHTIYNEWMREKGEGLHYVAFEVEDTEAWIEYFKSKGISILQRGERPGCKWTYLNTSAYTGVITELLERSEDMKHPK